MTSYDKLEKLLFPNVFFRLNRQIIANIKAINTTFSYSKSKLKVELLPSYSADIFVSQEKSGQFKNWLDDGDSK